MIPGSNKDHPSFLKSFSYAMEGFVTAVKTERNIKVMLVAGVCTVICRLYRGARHCRVGHDYHLLWPGDHGELCNTAMEAIVDLATQELHPLAKRAKDIAARLCIRSFHHRRDCGRAGICPRARLYLERDSHVRQYAAYR